MTSTAPFQNGGIATLDGTTVARLLLRCSSSKWAAAVAAGGACRIASVAAADAVAVIPQINPKRPVALDLERAVTVAMAAGGARGV